jgi:hypothetical protein
LGLKNNWTNKKNIIDYAVNLLKNGDNNINIVSIAAGEYLDSHEFFSLVLTQAENKFFDYDIDKWRIYRKEFTLPPWTDEIFKTSLAIISTKFFGDFTVLTSWLAAYTLPTPPLILHSKIMMILLKDLVRLGMKY